MIRFALIFYFLTIFAKTVFSQGIDEERQFHLHFSATYNTPLYVPVLQVAFSIRRDLLESEFFIQQDLGLRNSSFELPTMGFFPNTKLNFAIGYRQFFFLTRNKNRKAHFYLGGNVHFSSVRNLDHHYLLPLTRPYNAPVLNLGVFPGVRIHVNEYLFFHLEIPGVFYVQPLFSTTFSPQNPVEVHGQAGIGFKLN